MNRFSRLNPARRLVGRLFLWFWATFLVTAGIAIVATRLLSDSAALDEAGPGEVAMLTQLAEQVRSDRAGAFRLEPVLRRISRPMKGLVVMLNPQTGDVIKGGGPPLRGADIDDINRLSNQSGPVVLQRGIVHITGPVTTTHRGREYQLFLLQLKGAGPSPQRVMLFVGIALLITAILSYLFARSLVSPILLIQRAAGALATGQWQTRVAGADQRRDEIGTLARDFNAMAAQLERMWLAQQRLLADISHELRSPLTRLQMALGLAHQQQVDPVTLARIEREADRMERLIQQLLTLSRAESGQLTCETLSMNALLSEVFTDARFEANNLGKALELPTLPDVNVTVNADLLRRAAENVLRNALHYAAHQVAVDVTISATRWALTVVDDGPGLTAQECEQIFTPFYRVSEARERQSGGVGLGLSIAKAAVEMHDGKISASPNANGGLRVTLSFPRKDEVHELEIHRRSHP